MSSHHDNGRQPDHPAWSEQFCQNSWCRGGRWYVRADSRGGDLWQITEYTDGAPWTVAAAEPLCPLCGESLAAHVEGVGDIDVEPPAAILNFLRTLERPASA